MKQERAQILTLLFLQLIRKSSIFKDAEIYCSCKSENKKDTAKIQIIYWTWLNFLLYSHTGSVHERFIRLRYTRCLKTQVFLRTEIMKVIGLWSLISSELLNRIECGFCIMFKTNCTLHSHFIFFYLDKLFKGYGSELGCHYFGNPVYKRFSKLYNSKTVKFAQNLQRVTVEIIYCKTLKFRGMFFSRIKNQWQFRCNLILRIWNLVHCKYCKNIILRAI